MSRNPNQSSINERAARIFQSLFGNKSQNLSTVLFGGSDLSRKADSIDEAMATLHTRHQISEKMVYAYLHAKQEMGELRPRRDDLATSSDANRHEVRKDLGIARPPRRPGW